MRLPILAALLLLPAIAFAQELPKGPKAPPPEPLPDATCDTAKPDAGDWLLGHWVAPYSKWEFRRDGVAMNWKLEQKADINKDLGYKEGAVLTGKVDELSACSLKFAARDGEQIAFTFEGVRTEDGRIYGFADNGKGQTARWTLRRMK